MRIDPTMRALRSNPAPQRNAQVCIEQARQAWDSSAHASGVARDLLVFGKGAPLQDCTHLAKLFTVSGCAEDYVSGLMRHFLPALAAEPLAQVPFRHDHSEGRSILMLGQAGTATLTLHLSDDLARAGNAACSVRFSSGERHEAVLAGVADLQIFERSRRHEGAAKLEMSQRRVAPGDSLSFDSDLQGTIIERIEGSLVRLRLARTHDDGLPAQEFRLDNGQMIHQAAGSQSDSRQELMLALLGRMGRADAVPLMAEMALEGSDHLRWQALRECLALDAGSGFAALCKVAAEQEGALAAPAGALRKQLLEAHPALEAIAKEFEICLA